MSIWSYIKQKLSTKIKFNYKSQVGLYFYKIF